MPIPSLANNVRSPREWRHRALREHPKRHKRLPRWLVWLVVATATAITIGGLSTVVVFAWFSRDLPDPNNITDRLIAQSTKIYDRTGEQLLYDIHGEEKRTVVELDSIAERMKQATIVAEDKDFYRHRGFDLRGILRAVVKNIIRLDPSGQGGSTITQQFIKNSILTPEKSYIRKMKEVILAYQLEQRFSKDEILKLYLNEIPYGSNAYGVEAAGQNYFGVSAKDLSLAQSTLLASLPRAPTFYSPYGNHTDDLFARQRAILDAMTEEGYITKEDAEAARLEKLTFRPRREGIIAPHFVFYVRELLTQKYGEEVVEQGGLKVITTLDTKHQQAAEGAIAEFAETNEKRWGATNAAMVSLDTKTGQILAMVGSRDYFDIENDGNVNVALRPRQPGSSFKPVVYTAAFERGYTPETMVFDLVTNFDTGSGKPYTPHNYDGKEHGPLSLRQALAGSLNIPAVKVLYLAGVNRVLDTADRLGYTTLRDRSRFGLSLVLGGAEVKLLEHTSAFATLAREGLRHPTTPILRVENRSGKILEEYQKSEERVLDELAVRKTNDILSDNGARSFIFGARNHLTLPDRPVATKTGTTNDYRDAWTLGYTPSLAAGFWAGKNDNTEMKRGADGSVIAAPMWQSYMKKVLAGTPVETFKKPPVNDAEKPVLRGHIDVVHTLPVDRVTGRVIPASCRDTYPSSFVVQKEFKEAHTILHWVQKEDPRGAVPENPKSDPQYDAWEKPVREWTKKHNYPDLRKLPEERCDLRENIVAPIVTITSPSQGATLSDPAITLSADVAANQVITSVEFLIDGVSLQTLEVAPYGFTYTNNRFENGEHTLTVKATDALGTIGESSATFTLSLAPSSASLTIIAPQQNAILASDDFPLTLEVWAFHPLGLASLTLSQGEATLETKTAPKGGPATFSVASLQPGSQTLTVRLTPSSGDAMTRSLTLLVQAGSEQGS